jgi:hypothetical protein
MDLPFGFVEECQMEDREGRVHLQALSLKQL